MWYELTPAPRADTDDDTFNDRALRAADALGLNSRPSLLRPGDWVGWLKRENGMILAVSGERRWIRVPDRNADRAARAVAQAANATAHPADPPALLEDKSLKWAHAVVPHSATLARTARDENPEGDDVRVDVPDTGIVTYNIRRIGWKESKRTTDWLADEFNRQADTSKLRAPGLSVVRVSAGAPDPRDAGDLATQAGNGLNLGFTTGLSSHPSRPLWGRRILAILLALTVLPLLFATSLPLIVCLLPLILAAIIAFLPIDNDTRPWTTRPRHRWWFARTRAMDSSDRKSLAGGRSTAGDDDATGRVYAYAFHRSTLPLPAGALAAVATPPARRRGRTSALTVMPDALRDADGPLLGRDADGRDVRMWRAASYGGIMLFGEPGGGKSNLMHGIMADTARHHRTGDVFIDFESKGADGMQYIRRLIPGIRLIDLNDPDTPMISLLGDGEPADRAARFADLMRRALGDQQIGPQSRIQIRDAVLASLLALDNKPELEKRCHAYDTPVPADWVSMSARLLASRGVTDARRLGRAAAQAGGPQARDCIERLHGPVRDDGRPQIRDGELAGNLRAPMNKMDLLAQAPTLVDPRRHQITWGQLIARSTRSQDVLVTINLGPAVTTQEDGSHRGMGDDTRRLVGALLFRGLKDQVERSCAGWQKQDRHVRLFVDELADVLGGTSDGTAGGNADIIEWFRERGRGFGVELVIGSQNPLQLEQRLLASVTGFQTVGSFVLRTPVTAEPAARAVGVEPERIMALPRYAIAIRTPGAPPDLATQPPMILTVPLFDIDE